MQNFRLKQNNHFYIRRKECVDKIKFNVHFCTINIYRIVGSRLRYQTFVHNVSEISGVSQMKIGSDSASQICG